MEFQFTDSKKTTSEMLNSPSGEEQIRNVEMSIKSDSELSGDNKLMKAFNNAKEKFNEAKSKGGKVSEEMENGLTKAWDDFKQSYHRAKNELKN